MILKALQLNLINHILIQNRQFSFQKSKTFSNKIKQEPYTLFFLSKTTKMAALSYDPLKSTFII